MLHIPDFYFKKMTINRLIVRLYFFYRNKLNGEEEEEAEEEEDDDDDDGGDGDGDGDDEEEELEGTKFKK